MKLTDLNAQFVRFLPDLVCAHMHKREVVATLSEAQGVKFGCPDNTGARQEGYAVCVPFRGRGAPEDENGGIQWNVSGTGLHDLTLSPSVNVVGVWHGWVRNGEVTNA